MNKIVTLARGYTFDRNKPIGSGAQSAIYECYHPNRDNLCVRVMPLSKQEGGDQKDENKEKLLQQETECLDLIKKQRNAHLVTIYDKLSDEKYMYIIMQKCTKDLRTLLQEQTSKPQWFSRFQIKQFFKQIILGYQELLKLNIIHRDLKPANILVLIGEEGTFSLQITDFGFSKILDSQILHQKTKLGTTSYFSPQIYFQKEYTNKTDMYTLGLIFFQLSQKNTLLMPSSLTDDDRKKRFQQYEKTPFHFNENDIDYDFNPMIEKMLRYHEKDRPEWQQVIDYFTNTGIKKKYFSYDNFIKRIQKYTDKFDQISQLAADIQKHRQKCLKMRKHHRLIYITLLNSLSYIYLQYTMTLLGLYPAQQENFPSDIFAQESLDTIIKYREAYLQKTNTIFKISDQFKILQNERFLRGEFEEMKIQWEDSKIKKFIEYSLFDKGEDSIKFQVFLKEKYPDLMKVNKETYKLIDLYKQTIFTNKIEITGKPNQRYEMSLNEFQAFIMEKFKDHQLQLKYQISKVIKSIKLDKYFENVDQKLKENYISFLQSLIGGQNTLGKGQEILGQIDHLCPCIHIQERIKALLPDADQSTDISENNN